MFYDDLMVSFSVRLFSLSSMIVNDLRIPMPYFCSFYFEWPRNFDLKAALVPYFY